MNQIENIAGIVAQIQKMKAGDRPELIQKYLRGTVNPATSEGKQLLHRRALLMTALRSKGLI